MVKIEQLNFAFKRGFALKNISAQLQNGTYALLGSNGAGKTTLMRCLIGSYEYSGCVTIDPPGQIGYLPQSIEFFDSLTVWETMEYIYSIKKISPRVDKQEIQRCLQEANLTQMDDYLVKSLSGGMKRRLGVAQAILGDPGLLVFDEPTAGLDPEERMRFKNLVYRLNRNRDKVVLISTHIVDDVVGNCDQVIIMRDGEFLAIDTEQNIEQRARGLVYEGPNNYELYSGLYVEKSYTKNGKEYMRVLTAQPPEGFVQAEPTLEDGYLCLINQIG